MLYVSLPTAPHDALFVVGSLDEAVLIKGLRYHPVDIETSVIRSHKGICEWLVIPLYSFFVVAVLSRSLRQLIYKKFITIRREPQLCY